MLTPSTMHILWVSWLVLLLSSAAWAQPCSRMELAQTIAQLRTDKPAALTGHVIQAVTRCPDFDHELREAWLSELGRQHAFRTALVQLISFRQDTEIPEATRVRVLRDLGLDIHRPGRSVVFDMAMSFWNPWAKSEGWAITAQNPIWASVLAGGNETALQDFFVANRIFKLQIERDPGGLPLVSFPPTAAPKTANSRDSSFLR